MVNLNIMVVYPNAKINIGLYVTERRPDGYHNLETVFFPIQLADQISITPNGSEQCCFRMEGLSIDGSPEDNLILKTFRLFQERFHIGGVDIDFQTLYKDMKNFQNKNRLSYSKKSYRILTITNY